MPFTEKRLCNPTQLTTSGQTLYTVPASITSIIKQIVVTNVTASAATFSLYIGSAATPNALFSATSVAANDTIIVNLSQVLTQNEILTALASVNSALNITISGVENDGPLTPTATYIADQAVTTAKIADNSVTTAKIAAGAVVTADIADGAVTTEKIAANAVVTADIANNAVTQVKLSTDVPLGGFRNRVINGGFDIWQRSTDATTVGADQYVAMDRWRTRTAAGGGSLRASRVLSGLPGTTYCARIQRTASNTNTGSLQIINTFESVNSIPLAGSPITFSFYARSGANYSPTSSILRAIINTGTGTDQYWLSFTGSSNLIDQNVTLTTTWQRFTYTATPASNISQFSVIFEMNPTGTAGANDYYEITGVQLEAGSQVTPFEQRPFGTELSLCQRYYQRNNAFGAYGHMANGWGTSTSNVRVLFPYFVRMRSTPSTTIDSSAVTSFRVVDGAVGIAVTALSLASGNQSVMGAAVDVSATVTQFRPYWFDTNNDTNAYIGFSAEL
jgi:hypothetical protein